MPGLTPAPTGTGDNAATLLSNSLAKITYNDFTFPPALSLKLSVRPVPSTSGRVVKVLKGFLTIEFIMTGADVDSGATGGTYAATNATALNTTIGNGQGMSLAGRSIIRRLLEKGKPLSIYGMGPMDIEIDNSGSAASQNSTAAGGPQPDLDNGPTPGGYEVMRVFNARALHLVWTCEFTWSPCTSPIKRTKATINEFDFSVSYSLNAMGNMTRNVYGHVGLPNWVDSNTKMTAINPDIALGGIRTQVLASFPTVPAFTREHHFTTDPTRTKVQFSITDTRIPSDEPYFPGVARCDVTHGFQNKTNVVPDVNNEYQWNLHFSGRIEVFPGFSKQHAWNALMLIVKARLNDLRSGYAMFGFAVTEDVYGRSITISINYMIMATLSDVVKKSKLFTQIQPSSKWVEWDASRKKAVSEYGHDNAQLLGVDTSKDRVISICDGTLEEFPSGSGVDGIGGGFGNDQLTSDIGTNVSKDDSIMSFSNATRIHSDMNVAVQSLISKGDATAITAPANDPLDISSGSSESAEGTDGIHLKRADSGVENVVQTQGNGYHYLVMQGHCRRIKYPVQIPAITSVGSSGSPVLVKDDVSPSQLIAYTTDGTPIHQAAWRRVYSVPALGSRVLTITNVPDRYKTSGNDYPTEQA